MGDMSVKIKWEAPMTIFHSTAGRILIRMFLIVPAVILGTKVSAQSHGPCEIIYLVRDEKGELLDPAQLDSIISPKGEEMKAGTAFIKNPDGTATSEVKCLKSRLDLGGRPVSLSEMTLKYRGQLMRLRFNLQLVEEKRVIDSIPFRQGVFQLDKGKWNLVED